MKRRRKTKYNIWASFNSIKPQPHLLESHQFVVNPQDDFLCLQCAKPRALHLNDGFEPSPLDLPFPVEFVRRQVQLPSEEEADE